MATKKKKAKAPKKKVAARKPAAVAKKKPVHKPAKAAPKPAKKAAPKPVQKVAAPKPVVAPRPKAPARERWTTFPAVLDELAEWVNGGRAGEIDFEMYGAFNEQYKPSDWTKNPLTDDELFTFGMDGSGGQVAIWRRDDSPVESLPIVFLGSEGEVRPLAMSLPLFLHMIASGYGPIEIVFGGTDPVENEELMEWVKDQFPEVSTKDPKKILEEATKTLADFEDHLMAQVKSK